LVKGTQLTLSFIDYYRSGVGGGVGGGSSSFRDETRRGGFEEYDAGDDEDDAKPNSSPTRKTSMRTSTSKAAAPKPTPAPAPAPVVDLIGGLDDDTFGSPSTAPNPVANKALPSVNTKQTVGFDGIGSICYLLRSCAHSCCRR
jgi:epsin